MVGDKLYKINANVTGQRVLPGKGADDVKAETTFQGTGKVLGPLRIRRRRERRVEGRHLGVEV